TSPSTSIATAQSKNALCSFNSASASTMVACSWSSGGQYFKSDGDGSSKSSSNMPENSKGPTSGSSAHHSATTPATATTGEKSRVLASHFPHQVRSSRSSPPSFS